MINVLRYTLLENLRSKFTLGAAMLILAIAGLAHYSSLINYNAGDYALTVLTFGMYFTKLVLLAFLLFLPVANLSREIENGAVYLLLAKRVTRLRYLLGKYAAFLLLYGALLLGATLALAALAFAFGEKGDPAPLRLGYFLFAEFLGGAMLLALVFALYIAIRAPAITPMLAAVAFFVSLLLDDARAIADSASSASVRGFYLLLYYGFPNFRLFNLEKPIAYGLPVPPLHLLALAAYAALVTFVFLGWAVALFRKREL